VTVVVSQRGALKCNEWKLQGMENARKHLHNCRVLENRTKENVRKRKERKLQGNTAAVVKRSVKWHYNSFTITL